MKAIHSRSYIRRMPKTLGTLRQGKARLIYEIPSSASVAHPWGLLLFVHKDDVSTHNFVHKTPLPWKGSVLTAFSVLGFTEVLKDVPNHLVAYGQSIFDYLPRNSEDYPEDLALRALVVEKLIMHPCEYVEREHLCGSLFKGPYADGEDPYEIKLPPNLPVMSSMDASQGFTPTAKSERDEPLDNRQIRKEFSVGCALADTAWEACSSFFDKKGFKLVDGKLELGWRLNGNRLETVVGDEPPITPDSIRIARKNEIQLGTEPKWFGKENVRKTVENIWKGMGISDKSDWCSVTLPLGIARKHGQEDYYDVFTAVAGMSIEAFWDKKGFSVRN